METGEHSADPSSPSRAGEVTDGQDAPAADIILQTGGRNNKGQQALAFFFGALAPPSADRPASQLVGRQDSNLGPTDQEHETMVEFVSGSANRVARWSSDHPCLICAFLVGTVLWYV